MGAYEIMLNMHGYHALHSQPVKNPPQPLCIDGEEFTHPVTIGIYNNARMVSESPVIPYMGQQAKENTIDSRNGEPLPTQSDIASGRFYIGNALQEV